MKPTFNRLSRLSQIALAVSAITGGHATAASDTWTADAAGNWTVFSNWASTTQAPDNVGDIATFGSAVPITAPRIVTLNFTPITVGGLTFNNLGRSGIAQYSNPPTNTTLNNNVEFSNSGFSLSLGTQTLTLDTGTPGYNAADLVVIDLPTSNLTGEIFLSVKSLEFQRSG
ncbi:MAG: hypothetical protein Q8Q59_07815 [Luteolibacter sp.]|nr:hypothetical protein [Luteolibacter sp.]